MTCWLSAEVISGVRVLASVSGVVASVRLAVLVEDPWLWLGGALGVTVAAVGVRVAAVRVRVAALVCTARVEEEE